MQQLTKEQAKEIKPSELARLIFQRFRWGIKYCPQHMMTDIFPTDHSILPDEREEFGTVYQEAWYTLVRRGLIVRAWNQPTGNDFTLTSIGRNSRIQDDIFILVDDAQEVVNKLKDKVPNLDSVIEQYFLESLRACQEGLYISSVICLGAASERAIQCLAEAVINYDSSYKSDIEKKTKISELTRYLSDNINRIFKSTADGAFISTLKDKLEGIARLYRLNRNEAGHPQNIPQDWDRVEQENHLIQFRRYITTIYEAIDKLVKTSSIIL